MDNRFLAAAVLPSALLAAACSQSTTGESAAISETTHPAESAPRPPVEKADAHTLDIVAAARTFLASLDEKQRAKVLYGWDDADQRGRWSNFPSGIVDRRGLQWGAMNGVQHAKLLALLGTVLSDKGVANLQGQMAADDELARTDNGMAGGAPPAAAGGPPPGAGSSGRPPLRPPVQFGSKYYAVAFLGAPAADAPWMLQFGGHHLALNATVAGPHVSLSPMLTGGQPLRFLAGGQTINLAADERAAERALFDSLDAGQKEKAVVSATRSPLQLAPGRDGKTLARQGLPGSALNASQKRELLALIHTRLDMIDRDDAAPLLTRIEKDLDRTYFGWWGPTDANALAYVRVTGPSVVLEYSPEQLRQDDPTQHAHNIYRDVVNDYGKAWVPAVAVQANAGPGGP